MRVTLVHIGPSPFNRSIWTGLANGFQGLGHAVTVVDHKDLAPPAPPLPDLLFAVHGGYVPEERILEYRGAGVATATWLLDEPYEVDRSRTWSRHYDWVFSVDRATLPVHDRGGNAVHLPLGYDDTVFGPQGPQAASEILVLGSPYAVRLELLRPLIRRWGARMTWVGPGWGELCPAGTHIDGYVLPEDCAKLYRGAKVVLNIHRDSCWSHFGELNRACIEATHLNPRFWEAGACKAFQLCSVRDDLARYAPKAATFRDAWELDRKLAYFLDNAPVRDRNAAAVYRKVKDHTYTRRAAEILRAVGLKGLPPASSGHGP